MGEGKLYLWSWQTEAADRSSSQEGSIFSISNSLLLHKECQHFSVLLTPHSYAGYSISRDRFQSTTFFFCLFCVLLPALVEASHKRWKEDSQKFNCLQDPTCFSFCIKTLLALSGLSLCIV